MKKPVLFLLLLMFPCSVALAMDSIEREKIEYLISTVQNLQDSVFIRNGNEYDGRKAAEHLRMKLKKAGDRVKTVEDFISLCASKSSFSGRPYRIKFKDGRVIETSVFLHDRLRVRESQKK